MSGEKSPADSADTRRKKNTKINSHGKKNLRKSARSAGNKKSVPQISQIHAEKRIQKSTVIIGKKSAKIRVICGK
jgi:hypothetical protein